MSHVFKGLTRRLRRRWWTSVEPLKIIRPTNHAWRKADVSRHFPFRAGRTQWATLSGFSGGEGRVERVGTERHVRTPFPFGRPKRTDVGARLKDFEGATLFGDRRGSLRRNKRDSTERVRPLYYLSRCYPMNAQYIIWIADKGRDFSSAWEFLHLRPVRCRHW